MRSEGFGIGDIPDVGARNPLVPIKDVKHLDASGADAVVLSACMQMPSLATLDPVQDRLGLPVTSAAACTVKSMLRQMDIDQVLPGAGAVLTERETAFT